MSKDPAFLFYPNDYLGGTMGFSIEQHGLYILALVFQFNNGHFSESQINGVLNNQFNLVKHKFKTDGKVYWNERLDFEKERRANFVQSRRDSIDKRWSKNDKPLSGKRLDTIRMDVHTGIRMENENEDENRIKNATENLIKEVSVFIQYPEEMLQKFISYWTEPNKSKTKLRFQLEKTWDTSRRLNTWASRDKDFNKSQSSGANYERLN